MIKRYNIITLHKNLSTLADDRHDDRHDDISFPVDRHDDSLIAHGWPADNTDLKYGYLRI